MIRGIGRFVAACFLAFCSITNADADDHILEWLKSLTFPQISTDFARDAGSCKYWNPKIIVDRKVGGFRKVSDGSPVQPPNDRCRDAIPVLEGNFQSVTCNAARDGSNSCTPDSSSPDVWYKYTSSFDGNLVLQTFGSNYDTVLTAYTGCPGTRLNEIGCNDDCGSTNSCLNIPVSNGQTYLIRLSGFQDGAGLFNLNVSREGFITGKVTDQQTGQPLAGIQVLVYTPHGDFIGSVFTDRSGKYLVNGLATAPYIARTNNSLAYIDELYDDHICEGSPCQPDQATAIFVQGGSTTSHIDFPLKRGGTIGGTVTDSVTKLPLNQVEVHIHDSNNNHISIDFTDASGAYSSFDGLPDGDYLVFAFNAKGYVDELYPDIPCVQGLCNFSGGQTVKVVAGVATSGIDLAMPIAGDIHGFVTDFFTGSPVSGVQLIVHDTLGRRITSGSTDASGSYSLFDGLPAGTYYVRTLNGHGYADELYQGIPCTAGNCDVTAGQPVTISQGQITPNIDFHLKPGGLIAGTVKDADGSPLTGIVMDLDDEQNRHIRFEFTDAAGQFTSFYGLYSGNYFIRTLNFEGFLDELYNNIPCVGSLCDITTGNPIPVTLGTTTAGIDFTLNQGGTIAGNVTSSPGLPLSNTAVPIYDASTLNFLTYGVSDSCGEFITFAGLLSGNYIARTFNDQRLTDEMYNDIPCLDGNCNLPGGTPIAVTLGNKTKHINFELSSILMQDDFEDGVLDWNVKSPAWSETNGVLTGTNSGSGKAVIEAPVSECGVCSFEFDLNTTGDVGSKTFVAAWFQDNGNQVQLSVNEATDKWKLKQFSNGKLVSSGGKRRTIQPGTTYRVKIQFKQNRLRVVVDSEVIIDIPAGAVPTGVLQFRVHDTSTSFDNVLIR